MRWVVKKKRKEEEGRKSGSVKCRQEKRSDAKERKAKQSEGCGTEVNRTCERKREEEKRRETAEVVAELVETYPQLRAANLFNARAGRECL